ncbi:hypothetical protein GCK72_004906 [Caenorhabditis remanei]|uniref:F-box domain-containing protein n=1 Tax=Caenorhabditis remanei TaxID=31234 RepID=A0A6A5HCF2_CAERE|nr:hypothetical protein GCK72_004906 [Caenorhabditis remanei]KAF1764955.1 hypothetical protein GCK72_004906 [Caenorhabditis remanei]
MPLKFLSFPFLVQENILKNMELVEFFIMSTCSKRTKQSAILARKEVPKLRHVVKENEQSIMIRGEKSKTIIKILEAPRLRLSRMWKMSVGNSEFPTEISVQGNSSNAEYCLLKVTQIDETFLVGFSLYFNTLFRLKESTKLKLEFIKSAVRTPMFENVNEVSLSGETLTMDDLDSFLTLYPNLDVLKIKQSIDGELNETSRILVVKNVCLSNAGPFGMNLLTKFTGQNIYLNKVDLVEADLNEIIRKWINSEGYQNLVSVHATMDYPSRRRIQTDQVFNQLPIERFNPTERPEHVRYTTRVFRFTLDIGFHGDNCYDVIRKSDGKKASIRADFRFFRMVIWN